MKIKKTLDTYLPPDASKTSSTSDRLIVVIGTLIVLACLALIASNLMVDSQIKAKVPIHPSQWKITYLSNPDSSCSHDREVGDSCPASPNNRQLWGSSLDRGSKDFLQLYKEKRTSSYWMGVVIPAPKLREAARMAAPVLVLPKVNGSASVWVDGVFQLNHRFQDQSTPAQITLSRQRLMENRDLYVAIFVAPYPNYSGPQAKESSTQEGFFSTVEADHYSRWRIFDDLTQNLMFAGLFLLLAGVLWAASADNRIAYDYVVGHQLALTLALIALVSMDITARQFSVPTYYRLRFVLLLLEAFFVLRMTASILRLTRSSSWLLAAGIGAGTLLLMAGTPWTWIENSGLMLLNSTFLPAVYAVCAVLVANRAVRMYRNRGDASIDRVQFLIISACTFFATSAAYVVESSMRHALEVEWSRALNLVTIFCLVRLYIRSRRRKMTFIDSLPISRHHQQSAESPVHGWLVRVQLSSPRTWIQSKKNPYVDAGPVNAVVSHLWTIMQACGGEIVGHKGHCFDVLFEHNETVTKALRDLHTALPALCQRVKLEAPEGSFHPTISFHATIVKSSAEPVWNDGQPTWNVAPERTLAESHDLPTQQPTVIVSERDAYLFTDLPNDLLIQKVPDQAGKTLAA